MPLTPSSRVRIRVGVGAALGVAVAGILGWVAGLALPWPLLLAALLAAGCAFALASAPVAPPPVAVVAPPPAPVDEEAARWRSLRHDLRGILSPALLMADRLLMSTEDPLAKRAADAMIDAIERAEKRLSADPGQVH